MESTEDKCRGIRCECYSKPLGKRMHSQRITPRYYKYSGQCNYDASNPIRIHKGIPCPFPQAHTQKPSGLDNISSMQIQSV